MSIDGAFGSKTNVFTIMKPQPGSGGSSTSHHQHHAAPHKPSRQHSQQSPQQHSSKLTPISAAATASAASSDLPLPLSTISINPQACPAILKQILEILSTLARAAYFNFFPRTPMITPPVSTTPQAAGSKSASNNTKSHFWDIVVKLDQSRTSNKLSFIHINCQIQNLLRKKHILTTLIRFIKVLCSINSL